ncbi:MAG TPA: SH3 domain-containing protein [Steroidobacteraceae bacterium]|jgi:Bacterial SH3 domain|nr:SH3 domain-containing protein [Steroidobacteraceae bacterium]
MSARPAPAALLAVLAATQLAAPAVIAQAAPPAAPVAGQTRYVIEQLAVNVNSAADGSGTRVGTIKSGDKVELLESAGEAAHIRLANGRDGWVRAGYLAEAEPLRVQLAARSAEVVSLRQQLQALSAARAPAPAAAASPAGAAAAAPAAGPSSDEAVPEDSGESRGTPWGWLIGTALISLGVGFAAGWLVLDARVRRRYGGLRIY